MARTPDPSRKPAILAEIVVYLLDQPLATVSFRTLAAALGVSTYSLVYHFGNREQLMHEIMGAVTERQTVIMRSVEAEQGALDQHFANIRLSWKMGLANRSQSLMRLEFEAAVLTARDPGPTVSSAVFARWYDARVEALQVFGLSYADASVEARVLVAVMYGLQLDLMINKDVPGAAPAFERAVASYEKRIRELVAQANETPGESRSQPVANSSENEPDGKMEPWPAR
jgi:AcrR family transcriptional regulator